MSVSCFAPTVVSSAAEPLTVPLRIVHAPQPEARARRSGAGRALDVVAVLGRIVTLAALLILAGAAGGLLDGVSANEPPTVVATIGGHS
ncbi:hypothetical protein [Pseudonocardia sp. GCM10023141]|uniref:hypothetical protein n=1 Tax=Pseudonocardia sp. GCM10023141 TaxID=3252653 RepID=UPI00361D78A0